MSKMSSLSPVLATFSIYWNNCTIMQNSLSEDLISSWQRIKLLIFIYFDMDNLSFCSLFTQYYNDWFHLVLNVLFYKYWLLYSKFKGSCKLIAFLSSVFKPDSFFFFFYTKILTKLMITKYEVSLRNRWFLWK